LNYALAQLIVFLTLLIATYKTDKVYRYVRTPVLFCMSYVIYIYWNYELKLHLWMFQVRHFLTVNIKFIYMSVNWYYEFSRQS